MEERKSRKERREDLINAVGKMMTTNSGITKAAELYTLGLDYRKLQALVRDGILKRVKNGYYSLNREDISEEVMIKGLFPDGVLCMESALYYYHYLEVKPFQWHIAIDKNTSKSRFKMDYPSVSPYYTEPEVLEMGVTEIPFGEGTMKIYNKERLVCDCLKYEDKLEHEDLKQALIHYLKEEQKDIAMLMEFARERKVVQKVQNRIGVWL